MPIRQLELLDNMGSPSIHFYGTSTMTAISFFAAMRLLWQHGLKSYNSAITNVMVWFYGEGLNEVGVKAQSGGKRFVANLT